MPFNRGSNRGARMQTRKNPKIKTNLQPPTKHI